MVERAILRARRLHEVIEVVAGRENLALAADQDGAYCIIRLGRHQRIGQGLVHGARDRILAFQAVEFQGQNALALAAQNIHVVSKKIKGAGVIPQRPVVLL